jgi:transcriptional regulator with GAF, ATPase, and Fis domain/response regulator of citrate/malate metabolism
LDAQDPFQSAMSLKVLIVEDQFLEGRSLGAMVGNAGHTVDGIAKSVAHASALIQKGRPDIVLVDIYLKGDLTGIDLGRRLGQQSIPFIYISANSNASILEQAIATKPYGFLVKPFSEREIVVALNIAMFLYQDRREFLSRQRTWLRDLLRNIVSDQNVKGEKALSIIRTLTSFLPFDFVMIDTDLCEASGGAVFRYQRKGFDEYVEYDSPNPRDHCEISVADLRSARRNNRQSRTAYFLNTDDLLNDAADDPVREQLVKTKHFKAKLWLPFLKSGEVEMAMVFYCHNEERYSSDHLNLILSVQDLLAEVVRGVRVSISESGFANKPSMSIAPNQLLKPRIEGIIGQSPKLLEALDKVLQVAPYDNTVLILGETGVGKEGLVKAIHRLSARKTKPLIKVNCAAIPVSLVESELFGHEKGAFTGALERRIGKFEQANGGTLFLDEIGELPMDVQTKLLRAIQEKEIERVGGRTTIQVDVRIITATNRNLLNEIANGRFRLDLYYRINVYPIKLAPLRERREDISILAAYFLQMYGSNINRGAMTIAPAAMEQLVEYAWPGNIRELQHLIERHVLECKSAVIEWFEMPEAIPLPDHVAAAMEIRPFAVMDRDHILTALRRCNGKISGKGGAAEMLRLPPSTLSSKMKRLGIQWPPIPTWP